MFKNIIPLLLLLAISIPLFAQDAAINNEVSKDHEAHPNIHPLYPSIVSYEFDNKIIIKNLEKDSIVSEIVCATEAESISNEMISDFGGQEKKTMGKCAELDWRPVIDSENRLWYSYKFIENNEVYLGSIPRDLDCSDESCNNDELFPRSFNEIVDNVSWSPDGQSLLMNEGDTIVLFRNMGELLNYGNKEAIKKIKLDKGYFPVFSPTQQFIAYEIHPEERSSNNYDIRLMHLTGAEKNKTYDLNDLTNDPETNRYKASWSSDGNMLSFITQGYGEGSWAVRIYEIIDAGEDIYVEDLIKTRRNDIENLYRGYSSKKGISILSFFKNENDIALYAAPYMDSDSENKYPIKTHSFIDDKSNSMKTSQRRELENIINNSFEFEPTSNKEFLTAQGFKDSVRVAYSVQEQGRLKLRVDKFSMPNGYTTPNRYRPQEKNRKKAMMYSAIFPGLGQLYKGEVRKAAIMSGAAVVLATGLAVTIKNNSDKEPFLVRDKMGPFYAMGLASVYAISILETTFNLPSIKNLNPNIRKINIGVGLMGRNANGVAPGLNIKIN